MRRAGQGRARQVEGSGVHRLIEYICTVKRAREVIITCEAVGMHVMTRHDIQCIHDMQMYL